MGKVQKGVSIDFNQDLGLDDDKESVVSETYVLPQETVLADVQSGIIEK